MPGFGQGPFGAEPFGEWEWSRQTLWEMIPEFYRVADPDYGGYFEMLMESLRPAFDLLRLRIKDLETLRDPLRCRTRYDLTTSLRLGKQIVQPGRIEQQGLDGSCVTQGIFESSSVVFESDDIGKVLAVSRSSIEANNQAFTVSAIVGVNAVITDPLLQVDPGPLRWTLRPEIEETSGRVTVQVVDGDTSDIAPGWLINDGFSESFVTGRRRFLSTESPSVVERYGAEGATNGSGNFEASTGPFTRYDVGKRFSIKGMADDTYDGKYAIERVVSTTEVALAELDGTPVALPQDIGPLEWVLNAFPELDIAANQAPKGTAEQCGIDLAVTGAQASSSTAVFSALDVGKHLQVLNSSLGNDGVYEILTIVDDSTVTVDGTLAAESNLVWYVRETTAYGDLSQVEVRAESLLKFLAEDFGIVLDNQESDARQRSWVRHVTRWLQKKGTAAAYRALGKVSGFDLTMSALWRLAHYWFDAVPSENLVEVGEAETGRFGTDGSLTLGTGSGARFGSPTAAFVPSDVGQQIRISDAASTANNGRSTIATYIDANTVEFLNTDPHSAPDANNGALTWTIVRVYSDLPPTLPLYDEINVDLLHAIVAQESGGYDFRADKFCWEDDWSSDAPVEILSSSQTGYNTFDVTVANDTGAAASASIGSGANGSVAIEVDTVGTAGNLYNIIVLAPVLANQPLLTLFSLGPKTISVSLGTDASAALDPAKNTATLVAASIGAAVAGYATATASGTGADPLTSAEPSQLFTGGLDAFQDAPEVVVDIGRWQIVDSGGTAYWLESVPVETASGPPVEYTFSVVTLSAPPTGEATLRYVCDPQITCGFCPSYRVQVNAELGDVASEGALATERLWERLVLRLEQTTPAHVEIVLTRTQILEAELALSAEIEAGLVFSDTLYAPLTVYDSEVDADLYPADTVLTAEALSPAPMAIMRGVGTLAARGRST